MPITKPSPRTPSQPLQERPFDDPHVSAMLSRTLFREPTRRQKQRPRVYIPVSHNRFPIPPPCRFVPEHELEVSPELEERLLGNVSPVSPLTPEGLNLSLNLDSMLDLGADIDASANANASRSADRNGGVVRAPEFTLAIEPATPASELEPGGGKHWYFHDVGSNHYEEKHCSLSSSSVYTTLVGGSESEDDGRRGRDGKRGRWMGIRFVKGGVRMVRGWVRNGKDAVVGNTIGRLRKGKEVQGDLVVSQRVLVSVVSSESEIAEGEVGVKGKAKHLVRKGTKRLRGLSTVDKEGGREKGVWKQMRRIKGFQHIE